MNNELSKIMRFYEGLPGHGSVLEKTFTEIKKAYNEEKEIMERVQSIYRLPENLYQTIWNLNVQFAERESELQHRKVEPFKPELYDNIVVYDKWRGEFTIYSSKSLSPNVCAMIKAIQEYHKTGKTFGLFTIADCLINTDGFVVKNRHGDQSQNVQSMEQLWKNL